MGVAFVTRRSKELGDILAMIREFVEHPWAHYGLRFAGCMVELDEETGEFILYTYLTT